jgi:hypothetical protein
MLLTNPAPPAASYRRQSPRLEILDRLTGALEPAGPTVKVLDVSLSGLGIETAWAFEPGSVHRFRFTAPDGSSVVLAARVTHCHRRPTADGSALYLTGFRFVPSAGDDSPGALIDKITSAISFDIP